MTVKVTETAQTAAPTQSVTQTQTAPRAAQTQAQPFAPQQQAQAAPTGAEAPAAQAPAQTAAQAPATQPQTQEQAQQAAQANAAPQEQAEADPLSRAQAAGIAERLNAGDKVAVTVKVTETAQTAAPTQSVTQATEKTEAAQSARAALPKTPVPPKQIADQVKVSITKGVDEGLDKINIRLRPNELGRIEIKLNVGNDGTVRAMVTADRPETLDVLKRDSAGLEKALQDAGLKTGQDSLSFSLRDQSGQGSANNDHRNKTPYGRIAAAGDELGRGGRGAPRPIPDRRAPTASTFGSRRERNPCHDRRHLSRRPERRLQQVDRFAHVAGQGSGQFPDPVDRAVEEPGPAVADGQHRVHQPIGAVRGGPSSRSTSTPTWKP